MILTHDVVLSAPRTVTLRQRKERTPREFQTRLRADARDVENSGVDVMQAGQALLVAVWGNARSLKSHGDPRCCVIETVMGISF